MWNWRKFIPIATNIPSEPSAATDAKASLKFESSLLSLTHLQNICFWKSFSCQLPFDSLDFQPMSKSCSCFYLICDRVKPFLSFSSRNYLFNRNFGSKHLIPIGAISGHATHLVLISWSSWITCVYFFVCHTIAGQLLWSSPLSRIQNHHCIQWWNQ